MPGRRDATLKTVVADGESTPQGHYQGAIGAPLCGLVLLMRDSKLPLRALQLIAKSLPVDEISGMRNIFSEIDRDKNGTISLEEFREAMRSKGALEISRSPDLQQILKVRRAS